MSTKVAVVGMGIGKEHARVLSDVIEDAELAAICDINLPAAQEIASRHGSQAFGDYANMLDEVKPDGVALATPPKVHAEQTVLAAERGVHVFCEKPMAPSIADCDQMIEACAKAGVTLMIGFKKRFYPSYRLIRQRVEETGEPLLWANVRFALGRVEKDWFWAEDDGGGPLIENAIHEYDIIQFLMGKVQKVYASGGNLFMPHRAPQFDAAGVVLTFASGGVASLGMGYGSEWGFAREELALASAKVAFELQGPFDNPDSLRLVMRDDPGEIANVDLPKLEHTFEPQLRHFLDCVSGEAKCESTGEAGRAALRVALAAKQSIRDGLPIEI